MTHRPTPPVDVWMCVCVCHVCEVLVGGGVVQVRELGRLVEQRCPVAAMLQAAGTSLEFGWQLANSKTTQTETVCQ
eukprot:COSAG01_NODE_62134_length_286_cov_0.786096_1_plen_76_part_00